MEANNTKSLRLVIPAIIIILGPIIASMIIASSVRYFKNSDRYVEVKGLAEKIVKSDQATWQLTVSASSSDVKGIYSIINSEQDAVIAFIKAQGLVNANITKQPVSIQDNYTNQTQTDSQKKLLRYSANATIIVMSNDVNKVANAVQNTNSLIESGVVINYSDIAYLYNGLNSIKNEMLTEALANAKLSGEQFAKQSGSKVGKIKSASQGLFTISAPDGSTYNNGTINKKVRVVTSVRYLLK